MKKRVAIVATALLALSSLAACSSSGGTSNGTSSKKLTDITIGVVPFTPDAIIWHAIESGIFKKHGLNATTVNAESPIAVSAAMSSGKEQFGFMTTPVLINANLQGAGMQCVATVHGQVSPKEPTALVASKRSGITSLKGFAGKTIAQVQLGSINRLATLVLLTRAGVKDVKQISIPFPQMPQALASGRVDGAVIVVPFLQTALANGAVPIVRPDAELYAGGTIDCFAATTDYLKDHKKVATQFRAAMNEAIQYAKGHMQEVLKTLVKHMNLSPEAASKQKIVTNFKPALSAESIGEIQNQMKQYGWIKKTIDPKTMVWSPNS